MPSKRGSWKYSAAAEEAKRSMFDAPVIDHTVTRKDGSSPPQSYELCRDTHPVLKIGNGEVRGGSCHYPPDGMDIYVGLDQGMKRHDKFPWEEGPSPVDIYVPMSDGKAPSKPEVFKKLVQYLGVQLEAGKKIAVGCMAGHGRTGVLLSALYAHVTGDKDAIKWVRENYCDRAVESKEQVAFLVKHFGVSLAKGSKENEPKTQWGGSSKVTFAPFIPTGADPGPMRAVPDPRDTVLRIWGTDVRLTNL